jgi:hypothetical protein
MDSVNSLIEFDRLARVDGKKYPHRRFLYDNIEADIGRHFLGIAGPRGAGKTILLKQLALSREDAFYLSLDTLQQADFFATVKTLQERLKVKLFLLDEVHTCSGFEAGLKMIYDFLDVKVVFTSSMALAIHRSAHDLSRRVKLLTLYPFSLREYVYFKHGLSVTPLAIDDIVNKSWNRAATDTGSFFKEFLCGGSMPFSLNEPDPLPLLKNILKTVIYKDIARVSSLAMDELDTVSRMVTFIGRSGIDGINFSSLSRNLGLTIYKAEQYTSLLGRAFILHTVWPQGANVLREPKIVMALPYRLLYRTYEESLGGLREDFFIESARAAGLNVHYLKSKRGEKTPDYALGDEDPVVFEIGGKRKGCSQFKGFETKRKIILSDSFETEGIRRPLFLFGLISKQPVNLAGQVRKE